MNDEFKTISSIAEGQYSEKRSKFLAFAIPVSNIDEIKELVTQYQKKYYDARHACYAYMLGADRLVFRANDNGEPSGTAGKPILGQINSNELTDILIIVIRYFGGIKLGTSGLIQAYKAAATDAISNANIITKTVNEQVSFIYEFHMMNSVMKVIKDLNPKIINQVYDNDCSMTIQIRKGLMPELKLRLSKIETLHFTN
ncbi:MAG: YigZ family protein [Bacteroidaceae bacterium]|nr:YigZ family protein [Bacteroidaceae bacterium]